MTTDILNNQHWLHQMKSQWRASQLEDKGKVALKSLYLLFLCMMAFYLNKKMKMEYEWHEWTVLVCAHLYLYAFYLSFFALPCALGGCLLQIVPLNIFATWLLC